MLSIVLATLVGTAVAGSKPCTGAAGQTCCNPNTTPAQICPSGAKCEACGGGDSCECPASPSPTPSPGPGPSPPAPNTTTKRLTIVNGCKSQSIWIAHVVAGGVGTDPQDVEITAGGSHKFTTAVNGGGVSAARFWPKMGCDSNGSHCSIGDSGGPGEGCVIRHSWGDDYSHCAPPVDSKFEATFATPGSPTKDTVDMSLVDGFTLPFKLESTGGNCIKNGVADKGVVDCSALSLHNCPRTEELNGSSYDLRAINPKTGKAAGCYSPCLRLTDDKWQNGSVAPDSTTAGPYCCAGADNSPGTCNVGPITKTQYVTTAHSMCVDGYAYAYDDKRATICCDTTTEYKLTFYCPAVDEMQLLVV